MIGPPHSREQEISRLLRQAEGAWDRQDYQGSIALLQKASRLDPGNPSLMLQVARAYGLRYEFAAAQVWLEKAAHGRRAAGLTNAGQTCLEFEKVDLATGYLERASHEPDVTIGALVTLADIRLRERRIDDAESLARRAAGLDAGDARVKLLDARVRRARGMVTEAESLLRGLLHGAPYAVRVRGLHELADILDKDGRHEEAMATLLEVKNLQQPEAAPCLAPAELARNRGIEMERGITGQVLDRLRAAEPDLAPWRPIALLCGHPRSGTTLLEQILDTHPGVVSAEETKLMHDEAYLPVIRDVPEGTDVLGALDPATPALLRTARENYFRCAEKLLGREIGPRLLIDKNPALNMLIPMVVRVFPETRFIVAIRDPRDVILSCFMQALPITPVSCAYLSLESAARQYASVMGFWLSMRERLAGRWIEVRYEDLVDDLAAVSQRVLAFLGLNYDPGVLQFHEHARTKRINSPSHADVVKPVYRTAVGRWQNYRAHIEPCMPILAPFMRAFKYA
jgi:Tfp pilus assembly protein PilF